MEDEDIGRRVLRNAEQCPAKRLDAATEHSTGLQREVPQETVCG